jgi:hypothetical protein
MGLKTWYNGHGPRVRDESFAWLKAGIAEGRIPPPSRCSACGETRGHMDYHTEDYSRPFGPHIYAHELCFKCHMMIHSRFRMTKKWMVFVEQLENGAVYAPLMSRREIGKIWLPGWIENPVAMGLPRDSLEFFRSLTLERGYRGEPEAARGDAGRQAMMFDDV